MEVYLDNSATTRIDDTACEAVLQAMKEDYGNPSSMHRMGFLAEQHIRKAKETFCSVLKCQEDELYFTSGGTESNNWALAGAARANRRKGNHILVSPIEHPSVSAPLARLSEEGFAVEQIRVDRTGRIDTEDLRCRITPETILVSVMAVNNEIGTVQDLAGIGRIIKSANPDTIFHTDAVQAFGKYRIIPKRCGIDLMSASSHKLHGPKGAGFLFAGKGIRLEPLVYGGGQQKDMRSGTENVPGISGFAAAAEKAYKDLEASDAKMRECRELLEKALLETGSAVMHGRDDEWSAPHILNISFPGIRSEVMLHALEEKGIYVSAGSACSVHKKDKSPTLTAIGCSRDELDSAIRFSLSRYNTKEEILYTIEVIRELIPALMRYVRR